MNWDRSQEGVGGPLLRGRIMRLGYAVPHIPGGKAYRYAIGVR